MRSLIILIIFLQTIILKVETVNAKSSCPNIYDPNCYLDDSKGNHGMILFGGDDGYYLSHLPMWMNPHDYQVLAKVEIPEEISKEIGKMKLGKTKIKLFSIRPLTNFVLPKWVLGEVPTFQSGFYSNHFERGGKLIGKGSVKFIQNVFFKKLNKKEKSPPPSKQKYILFGTNKSHYMVHMAHGGPEIDEILEINKVSDPNMSKLIGAGKVLQLNCQTADTKKNMDGLDELKPQNCFLDKASKELVECLLKDKILKDDKSPLPSSNVEKYLGQLFKMINIKTNIYTDTKDLGSGMHHY